MRKRQFIPTLQGAEPSDRLVITVVQSGNCTLLPTIREVSVTRDQSGRHSATQPGNALTPQPKG
jgi:hypothetical protein